MNRHPARERYDAVVGVFPFRDAPIAFGFGLVKLTYRITAHGLVASAPEALRHDIRSPDAQCVLRPGSDFWPQKRATDVIVRGSAFASRPVRRMRVSIAVGRSTKRIEVFGRRLVHWTHGQPWFGDPEPFSQMPITNANAYGGFDGRVPMAPAASWTEGLAQQWDHPGLYPRNPFGKGYFVVPEPVEGVELPNLEHPDDLLTPERFIVRNPELWYRQPLPWSFEHHHPMMFPRYVYLGADAWFPVPPREPLAEIRHGWLHPDYRTRYVGQDLFAGRPAVPELFQEASLGLSFDCVKPGTRVVLRGMHPHGRPQEFAVPTPPRMELTLEGRAQVVRPHLATMLVEPSDGQVSFTYVGILTDLPRVFVPGIHAEIPLMLRVDADRPLFYDAPPTVRSRMDAARAG